MSIDIILKETNIDTILFVEIRKTLYHVYTRKHVGENIWILTTQDYIDPPLSPSQIKLAIV